MTDARAIFDEIASVLAAELRERDTRLQALERRCCDLEFQTTQNAARVKSLEARPELKYVGVFREGQRYTAGSLTTRSGSLWFAETDTDMEPGEALGGWRLIVKKGTAS